MPASAGFTFATYDAAGATLMIDLLVRVYLEVYADKEDELFGEDRYRRQLAAHMPAPGWTLVTATGADGELAGYAYGFALPPKTGWWKGLLTPVDPSFLEETGARTFAVSEIMVRKPARGQGLGRALHDHLLTGRPEERATLLVEEDNDSARALYIKWGWVKFAEIRPNWEGAPIYEAMILPLSPAA